MNKSDALFTSSAKYRDWKNINKFYCYYLNNYSLYEIIFCNLWNINQNRNLTRAAHWKFSQMIHSNNGTASGGQIFFKQTSRFFMVKFIKQSEQKQNEQIICAVLEKCLRAQVAVKPTFFWISHLLRAMTLMLRDLWFMINIFFVIYIILCNSLYGPVEFEWKL